METSGVNAVEAGDYEIGKDRETVSARSRGRRRSGDAIYTRGSDNTARGTQVNGLCSCDSRTLRTRVV